MSCLGTGKLLRCSFWVAGKATSWWGSWWNCGQGVCCCSTGQVSARPLLPLLLAVQLPEAAQFVHTGHHPCSSRAPHLGELLAERTLCRPKSVAQLHWTFLQIYPLGSPALKRGTWLLPCPAQTTHGKMLGEAVLQLQESGSFPQGFFWVVLYRFGCCAVLCTSAPAEKSGLEAVRSNLKGKWLFLEFHREEADIGSLKQDTRRDMVCRLEKRVAGRSTNPPCANRSCGGELTSRREDTRCGLSQHPWLCSRGLSCLSRLGSRHHWG